MRKVWAALGAAMVTCMLATPAVAATKPPTADQLVRTLVKAGVCEDRAAVNATGTIVQCVDRSDPTVDVHIDVHAFPKRAAMLRDLDKDRAVRCRGEFPDIPNVTIPPPDHVDYMVGPNWWTPPFGGSRRAAVQGALHGKITSYACT